MDVAWFLNQRLDFILQLYARSSAPFVERQTKIENEEEPFVPPYSEDPEAFVQPVPSRRNGHRTHLQTG
ncbi:TPA: hypothetical protein QDC20_006515 [Burkholderia aenigmatica]|uniref:hypothetical protein n=1 Tax=Burkholderia sp. AU45251 TaxID=3059204 RepID=UPI00264BD417|nr:hypothetical protein [Burkholderia sp. AU45251]HDR9486422.1 hypothetical protein [Burkholderia aenigmatica]MDN7519907.1 hypothetical protein [Burkholderia sp. AU45251]HDR9517079.1 hypothetical protein [Burkholderia aenigmatica]HDR9594842.1 hypothetical protein [Burkholderia aenigmatica]HDR9600173.1 hypothetical protein [Burkholderia aenigmatica]